MIRTIRHYLPMAVASLFGVALLAGTASAAGPHNVHFMPAHFAPPAFRPPVVNHFPVRALPAAPVARSPQPLQGFNAYSQVPFTTASVSPYLPGAANNMLSPGLLRYYANAQALQNFGQYANIPPYAYWNPYTPSYNFGPVFSSAYYNPYGSYGFGSNYLNPYAYSVPSYSSYGLSGTGY